MLNYEAFREQYEKQHPASVPVPPGEIRSEYPRWLRGVVLPNAWEKDFVVLAQQLAPTTPILQARMLPPTYRYWSGTWRALSIAHNGELTWRVWRPE